MPTKLKLGDILVQNKFITDSDLNEALELCSTTNKKLGQILVEQKKIKPEQLSQALAKLQSVEKLPKMKIGEIFQNQGLITQDDLDKALIKSKSTGKKLGQTLLEMGKISSEHIAQALALQMRLNYIDVRKNPPEKIDQSFPENLARKFNIVILDNQLTSATVLMSDPGDIDAYDALENHLRKNFEICVSSDEAITQLIDRFYKNSTEINNLVSEISKEFVDIVDLNALQNTGIDDAPVVKLLQSIFETATSFKASDIHIEPMDKKLIIRFRIDGSLIIHNTLDIAIAAPLIQRLKLISGLDISEKRLPQDGRFNIKIFKALIDMRIATTPTAYGEAVVMRILSQNSGALSLDRLGLEEHQLKVLQKAIESPQGLILVSGPTGSGKTTTLYSCLNSLNEPGVKIITVEDPVEYRIDGINQIQVHERIGLTFNGALRSILRQDPDIILIGEMRDTDTVAAAVRASMTGHLVLSTIHTNDAKSVPARLLDMGAERFMVASSLQLVIAQRLVRLNCSFCHKKIAFTQKQLDWIAQYDKQKTLTIHEHYVASGCGHCNQTGFTGRLAVYELLPITKALAESLFEDSISEFTKKAEIALGANTLLNQALKLVEQGLISLTEAKKLAPFGGL